VLETGHLDFAIAFEELALLVGALDKGLRRDTLGLIDLPLHRVLLQRHAGRRQFHIAIRPDQLHAAHQRGPHHDPVRDPAGAVDVGRAVGNDQMVFVRTAALGLSSLLWRHLAAKRFCNMIP
jgi:hypothetical protein